LFQQTLLLDKRQVGDLAVAMQLIKVYLGGNGHNDVSISSFSGFSSSESFKMAIEPG
jgi:hypothetical protein